MFCIISHKKNLAKTHCSFKDYSHLIASIVSYKSIIGKIKFNIKYMPKFSAALMVTHVIYRKNAPFDKLEGPYSSVEKSLSNITNDLEICHIPIDSYLKPLTIGNIKKPDNLFIPQFLSRIIPLKYTIDGLLIFFIAFKFILSNRKEKSLVIGIDPLSCLPLVILRKLFKFTLVFYSVDFNRNRFKNKLLQKIYEIADGWSTKYSDQTWVVCESLLKYKLEKFQIKSIYIPNSSPFDKKLFLGNRHLKNSKKIAWTGTLLTDGQFDILFRNLKEIQNIKQDAEFYLAPINNHEKFKEYFKKYEINNGTVLNLHSRLEWQEFAAKCDVGIAIYDENFGSTEFIEPLKIWDFLICGMPFIISREPSISTPIKNSGVVYQLDYKNIIPKDNTLKKFLEEDNLKKLQSKCIDLAKEFDIKNQIEKAIATLN